MCNICLKTVPILPCSTCTFVSCETCIKGWFISSRKFNCPQCKKDKSYNINYNEIRIVSDYEDEEEQYQDYSLLLQENRHFTPEDFIETVWNPLPQNIKDEWDYIPIKMLIEENIETVAYKVHKKSNGLLQQEAIIITQNIEKLESELIFSILKKEELSDEDIKKIEKMFV